MNAMHHVLWVVAPYIAISLFVGGLVWRYRHDRLGWTTRSSQLHEQRLLRLGSPMFHFGVLATLVGHVLGILVPKTWTRAFGVPDWAWRVAALALGVTAGSCVVVGLALLLYRRRVVGPVAAATTGNDRIMYALLVATAASGLTVTVFGEQLGHQHDYRETVAPWFRSILVLRPRGELMRTAPLGFQLHGLTAWALLAHWPFSRLVHAFGVPLGYLTRPYLVYRSRA